MPRTQKLPTDLNTEAKLCVFLFCLCVFSKQMASMCHSVPMLKVEEWPLPGDSLTGDTVRALIDRVSVYCNLGAPDHKYYSYTKYFKCTFNMILRRRPLRYFEYLRCSSLFFSKTFPESEIAALFTCGSSSLETWRQTGHVTLFDESMNYS